MLGLNRDRVAQRTLGFSSGSLMTPLSNITWALKNKKIKKVSHS